MPRPVRSRRTRRLLLWVQRQALPLPPTLRGLPVPLPLPVGGRWVVAAEAVAASLASLFASASPPWLA
jgi:hypothetical protein